MPPSDTRAPFQRIPWINRLLARSNTIVRLPGCRDPKASTEDSLLAEILKTPRTVRSCICIYTKPTPEMEAAGQDLEEVTTLMTMGDGMNGHPAILHGGITATLLDESMGIFLGTNRELKHIRAVKLGKAMGELPPEDEVTSFTVELKVTYLRPVRTPGAVAIAVKSVKREGRKYWLRAELKQWVGYGEDEDGEVVVCATGEGLFVEPKLPKSKI